MYRRNRNARLLTGGLVGALPVTTPGDEHWDSVSLLIRGDTIANLSDNSLTVTAYDDATTSDVETKFASRSLSFDGVDDTVGIANNTAVDLSSGDWTIECWCYHIGQLPPNVGLFGKRATGSDYAPWLIVGENNNDATKALRFFGSLNGSSWGVPITGTADFPLDQWVHVAVTRSGNVYTLWQNGASIGTTTVSGSLMTNSDQVTIGLNCTGTPGTNNYWDGYIEDFRITKGVARYTGPFDPPEASLPTNAPVVGRRGVGNSLAEPIEMTYEGSVEDVSNTASYAFTVPASVPDNCLLVVCCGAEGQAGADIGSMSGGGYTWTKVATTGQQGFVDSAIFVAEVTTAPSTVTMTTDLSASRAAAQFYSVTNYASATPAGISVSGSTSATSRSATLTGIREGDAMIAFCSHSAVASMTWSGVTENFDTNTSEPSSTFSGGADYASAGVSSQEITATFSGSAEGMAIVAVAFTAAGTTYPLRTRGYIGAAPAGGGMLTLYDRYIDTLT